MAKSEEQVKSLLMGVKKESKKAGFLMRVKKENKKAGLKLNIQKTKIMASSPITSWQIQSKKVNSYKFCFLGLQNHCRWWLQPWN